jgi:N-acetylmuramoyl-L-alanine amidase
MSRYTWLLDPGHGGFIDGIYQTAGKRSPEFPDGSRLYEGEFNRDVVSRIMDLCSGMWGPGGAYLHREPIRRKHWAKFAVDAVNLVDTEEDVSLRRRVSDANEIHREKGNCIYVSVHANAFGNGRDFNNAKGTCTFYHYRSETGEVLAKSLQKWLAELTPFRDRGIRANETWANFYVLRKTHMPAVLSENGFMTNFDDAINLMDPNVRQAIANAHYNMILEIEENGL